MATQTLTAPPEGSPPASPAVAASTAAHPRRRRGLPTSLAHGFSSRANSIGFFRWLMAFSVIFSHAGPVAGFYGQQDLGANIGGEESLGGVAVAGFFFFSGFLITRSRRNSGVVRYFWRRCLRILPAFWTTLLLTAFVLAPIGWLREQGSMQGFWNAPQDSPLTYVPENMFLVLHQRNISGMGTSLPYAKLHGYDWNGSAWTLVYEFKAYILVGILGLVGLTLNRYLASVVAMAMIAINTLTWAGVVVPWNWPWLGQHWFSDLFNMTLLAPFALGMLFALWSKYVPITAFVAVPAIAVALYTYFEGNWTTAGQYGFLYFLMWGAVRFTWLRNWEKFGDFSYGVYIFAWPLMTFFCFFGLQNRGPLVYLTVIVLVTHVVAFASWHLIEKPAMSLKDWSPSAVLAHRRTPARAPARAASTGAPTAPTLHRSPLTKEGTP